MTHLVPANRPRKTGRKVAIARAPAARRRARPNGRPRKNITRRQLVLLSQLAGLGLTTPMIAAHLGMSVDTLRRRTKEEPEVLLALEKGKVEIAAKVANALVKRALRGDISAIIWWEKSRLHYSERHTVEHTHVKREDVLRVLTDMAVVVERVVTDHEERAEIRAGWMALNLKDLGHGY